MSFSRTIKTFIGTDDSPDNQADAITNEVEHINQELYKKGAELAERNKTLALLQKINTVILSSITHHEEIAQQVASIIVNEGNFELVSILLQDKDLKALRLIGCAH